MASKMQVTILYICTELLCFVLLSFAANIARNGIELTVPNNARVGHIVTKLGCNNIGIVLQTDGSLRDDELFQKLFSIDNGNLVVKSDLSPYSGTYFPVSSFSDKNCFSNIPFKRVFSVFIQNSIEYFNLDDRLNRGFIGDKSKLGLPVEGLDKLKRTILSDNSIFCTLSGDQSELFDVTTSGIRLLSVIPDEASTFYFTLQCYNGKEHGHTGLIISTSGFPKTKISKEQGGKSQARLVKSFEQGYMFETSPKLHRRYRRDTTITDLPTRSVQEGSTSNIYTITNETPNLVWSIFKDDSNTFQVSSGVLSVKSGSELDYDNGQRTYNVEIEAKTNSGQQVWIYRFQITITDKNDEAPVFTTHPRPIQARVDSGAGPGTSVIQLTAFDPDTNNALVYQIEGSVSSNFNIGSNNGLITVGSSLSPNQEYSVNVTVRDTNAVGPEQKDTVTVYIYTRNIKPQFNETSYTVNVLESKESDKSYNTLSPAGYVSYLYAINFQEGFGGNIEYQVLEDSSESTRFKLSENDVNGGRRIVTKTSFDYETDQSIYNLIVKATDSLSKLSSSVSVTVYLMDVNEYSPTFSSSIYEKSISESSPNGTSVLTVEGSDRDKNSKLSFTVSNPLFRVDSISDTSGILKVNGELDYDTLKGHIYEMDVYVHDNGTPSKSGSAKIAVTVTNVNDNKPKFENDHTEVTIKNNTVAGTNIFSVLAVDIDGDKITYSFSSGLTSEIFQIESSSGDIIVRSGVSIPDDRDQYILTVLATDDGSCCNSAIRFTSTMLVTVNIVDPVNKPPSFKQCGTFEPTVKEEQQTGTYVATVTATDDNRGDNGVVNYYAVYSADDIKYFAINQTTGAITTLREIDREELNYIYFTVHAQDKGQPDGNDYCTFKVNVEDINDNSPVFRAETYTGSVDKSAAVNTEVITVIASDKDIAQNAELRYQIINQTSFFTIEEDTGIIRVASSLSSVNQTELSFHVIARDKGEPVRNSSEVKVVITLKNVTGTFPEWSNTSPVFYLNETFKRQNLIGSLTATPRPPDTNGVDFVIITENGKGEDRLKPFIISVNKSMNQVNIRTTEDLDYEKVQAYINFLQIRAIFRNDQSEIYVKIYIQDENDEIPQFGGKDAEGFISAEVAENLPLSTIVTTVYATDADITAKFRNFSYELTGNHASDFTIDKLTGVIRTNTVFDREALKVEGYVVEVDAVVNDGYPSIFTGQPNTARATVKVKITDVNDNAPRFDEPLYTAQVSENAVISTVVIIIEAKDEDDATFQYSIDQGSPGASKFSVNTKGNKAYIIITSKLDFETPPNEYNITLRVSDGVFSNASTTVQIFVLDENDNAPKFDKQEYEFRDVTEEVDYSTSNPLYMFTAIATDNDKLRPNNIEYGLVGEADVIDLFRINQTGAVSLVGKLNRDEPFGRSVYIFNLKAVDEPNSTDSLTGYATVKVHPKDINDNAPVFQPPNPTGAVDENSPSGTFVFDIKAIDYDEGINAQFTFAMVDGTQKPRPAFAVSESGSVTTIVDNLDRETEAQYTFEVVATDKGTDPQTQSSTATATINIKDKNDNPPHFEQKAYYATIPETHQNLVIIVSATDPDEGPLTFKLDAPNLYFFTVTTIEQSAYIYVYNNPDYEKGEVFFNITVTVDDGQNTDTANVYITIEDVNDEVPEFDVKYEEITKTENTSTPIGTSIATFKATDRDTGKNGEIRYYIMGEPRNEEPKKYFRLGTDSSTGLSTGEVITNQLLDRETIAVHTVYILAIDGGYPENTGTATLKLILTDINDNPPGIRGSGVLEIEENKPAQSIGMVYGEDPDRNDQPFNNGPPFGFQPQCGSDCKFQFLDMPAADGGNGGLEISSLVTFDRETKEYYEILMIMWDRKILGNSLTATNTLTVRITDVNDNNGHTGATQNIHVYNYKGMFKDIVIGEVTYTDKDDPEVDRKDKEFRNQVGHLTLFSVDKSSGAVTMIESVASGTYSFSVDVYDKKFQETATSTVVVRVEDLAEEAPYKSGSVRIKGTTPEKFITKGENGISPYDKFKSRLTDELKTKDHNVNVQMITVYSPKEDYTDVRFSAYGSPYLSPTRMNSAVLKNKNAFETDSGGTIKMIGIDECIYETCESGCYNYLDVTGRPSLVNNQGNSIVGVETLVQGKCGCNEPVNQTSCDPTYCYNGGTCVKDYWNVLSCKCPSGFEGPRCQSTHHGFNGTGYALFKSLDQCANSVTTIEFITTKANGLIMYYGPVSDDFEPQDYLSLELNNGYPLLKVDLGSGVLSLTITSKTLNDGKWHHIRINKLEKLITMTVDHCKDIAPSTDTVIDDRSACEASASTPGENKFLNVNAPLQMGGRYTSPNLPQGITTQKFDGCVRNLWHNNELFNLYTDPGAYPGSTNGCPSEDSACGNKCGNNGDCQIIDLNTRQTICVCHSKYRGDNCEIETSIKDLKVPDSYIDWNLQQTFLNMLSKWETVIHVMYRTRDNDGVVFHVSSTVSFEFLRLQIVSNHLKVLYNLGDGSHALSLDKIQASDGQWHVVKIKRQGKLMSLSMDNGEGPRYVETMGTDDGHHLLDVKGDQIYSGGALDYSHSSIKVDEDLNSTCLRDIRLAVSSFPMTNAESVANSYVKISSQRNTEDSCVRNDCNGVVCPPTFVCRPLWEYYECVCPEHFVKVGQKCEAIDYCSTGPCHPDATCVNKPGEGDNYICQCQTGYSGPRCYKAAVVAEEETNVAAIIVPIIAVIFVIIIILILIWFIKCRNTEDVLIDEEKEDYEVRENVMDYDEEGAGEDDYEGHITGFGRLPDTSHFDKPVREVPLNRSAPPQGGPGIGDFIGDRLDDANDDSGAPPYDTMKEFDYEGGGSDAGTLSSLNTSTSGGDQDYDYLNEWGPKFAKLADMYNNPNYEDSD